MIYTSWCTCSNICSQWCIVDHVRSNFSVECISLSYATWLYFGGLPHTHTIDRQIPQIFRQYLYVVKSVNKLPRILYVGDEAVVNYWPISMAYLENDLSQRIGWSQSIVAPNFFKFHSLYTQEISKEAWRWLEHADKLRNLEIQISHRLQLISHPNTVFIETRP